MKALLEVLKLDVADVITTSEVVGGEDEGAEDLL